ncbi:MAG: polymer-forming cytoskeletal protein [Spirochaetales bacterium]|nr:polymer-forming cytoskeletal protein [Spirochaetales bacterium]
MAKTNEMSRCIIGEGSVFEGRFYISGSILIEGKFQGDIKTDDQVIVGPTGKVKTDISAKKVTVAGTLIGNIKAEEEVNLLQSGKVLGNIVTPRLVVEQGVVTEGKIVITAENNKDISGVIKESFGADATDIFADMAKGKKEKARPKDASEDSEKRV